MEDFNNYTFYKECLWDELNFNMYMNVFDEACCCCWCCIWTSSMRHFKCVHVFRILCSNCIDLLWGIYCSFYSWCLEKLSELAIMNTLFMIFWMCNFFWFNLIEKKIEKSQWVLAQMVPHFHIRECIPWLCKLTPKKLKFALAVYIEVKFMSFWMF